MRAIGDRTLDFHMRQKHGAPTLAEATAYVKNYEIAHGIVEASDWDAADPPRRKPAKVNEAVLSAVGSDAKDSARDETLAAVLEQLAALSAEMKEIKKALPGAAKNGPPAKNGGPSKSQSGETRTCFNCGLPGHLRNDCPQPRKPRQASSKANRSRDERASDPSSDPDSDPEALEAVPKRAFLKVLINGHEKMCLLDSGCETSIVPPDCAEGIRLKKTRSRLLAANGTKVPLLGEARLRVRLDGLTLDGNFLVSKFVSEPMLGIDWLERHRVTWNYGPGSVTIDGRRFSLVSRPAAEAMCRRVLVQEEVTIPPRTEMILKGQYCVPGRASTTRRPCTWALEPCAVRKGVYVASAVMPSRGDNLPVYVANTTEKPVTLRQGCEVADAVPVDCRLAEAAPDERPSVGAALKKQLGGTQSQVTA